MNKALLMPVVTHHITQHNSAGLAIPLVSGKIQALK